MWLIWSVAAFVTSVLVHAIVMRFVGDRAGTVAIFFAIGGVAGVALIGYFLRSYGFTPPTLAGALTYSFAREFYIFVFTLVGNSVSLGLLTKLERTSARACRYHQLLSRRYHGRATFRAARTKAISSGPVQAGLRLTARGKSAVRMFSFLRAIFGRPNRWVARTARGSDYAS